MAQPQGETGGKGIGRRAGGVFGLGEARGISLGFERARERKEQGREYVEAGTRQFLLHAGVGVFAADMLRDEVLVPVLAMCCQGLPF